MRPAKPGWFWLWPDNDEAPRPVRVHETSGKLYVTCAPFSVPIEITHTESWGEELEPPARRPDA